MFAGMKTLRVFFLIICFTPGITFAQEWKKFEYRNGDLLFQDIDCGRLCEAIETVTPALNGKHFSHMGMVCITGDSVYVIEAIGKDVHLTHIDTFLYRQLDSHNNPKIVVGRLKAAYEHLNATALDFALQQRGKPYDDIFIYNNGKYYCSELIYDAYKAANGGEAFFSLSPMTFKDPTTGKTFEAWDEYYQTLEMTIPEGEPGCNPGSIAGSNRIDVVVSFY